MDDVRNRYDEQKIVCLQFHIGQRVAISGIEEKGTIYSALISRDGIEYCVKWFNESGVRNSDWFRAEDLSRDA